MMNGSEKLPEGLSEPLPGTHWPPTTMYELDQYWCVLNPEDYIRIGKRVLKKHRPDWDDDEINKYIVECMRRLS